MAKRKKGKTPKRMIVLWDVTETRRLIETAERLHTLARDLEALLSEPKRRAEQAAATRRAKAEADKHAPLPEGVTTLADALPTEEQIRLAASDR